MFRPPVLVVVVLVLMTNCAAGRHKRFHEKHTVIDQHPQRFLSAPQHSIYQHLSDFLDASGKTPSVKSPTVDMQSFRSKSFINQKLEWSDDHDSEGDYFKIPPDEDTVQFYLDYISDSYTKENVMPSDVDVQRVIPSLVTHVNYKPFSAIVHNSQSVSETQTLNHLSSRVMGLNVNGASLGMNTFKIFYDSNVPSDVRNCVDAATIIWTGILGVTRVPITLSVSWKTMASGVLASTGPSYLYLFKTKSILYPDSIANQMYGEDIDPLHSDIRMSINQAQSNWNTDISNPPPSGKYDMMTVVLHEIWHGLGGIGVMGKGSTYRYPSIYDSFIVDEFGSSVWGRSVNNLLKYDANDLYFECKTDDMYQGFNPSVNAALYFPTKFAAGSSIYHISETAYQTTNPLVTPFLNKQERILNPGPIALSILDTIGWNIRNCSSYDANCAVCVNAGCIWCSGSCSSIYTRTDSCDYYNDAIYSLDSCPACYTDVDCNDVYDVCTTGTCNRQTGACSYDIEYNCDDGDPCSTDVCDSSKGCIHHFNSGCDTSFSQTLYNATTENYYAPCDSVQGPSRLLQNGYFCKLTVGETLSIGTSADIPNIVSISLGTDIPVIPSKFFGKKSLQLSSGYLRFGWCDGDTQYFSFSRYNSVRPNTTAIEISNIMVSRLRLCSTENILVKHSSGSFTVWKAELSLSSNSKIPFQQKSQGFMSFNFVSGTEFYATIYADVIPKITFYSLNISPVQQKTLDYSSSYFMPYVNLVDGLIQDVDLTYFAGSYYMSLQ